MSNRNNQYLVPCDLKTKNTENISQILKNNESKIQDRIYNIQKQSDQQNVMKDIYFGFSQENEIEMPYTILNDKTITQVSSFDHSHFENNYFSQDQSSNRLNNNKQQVVLVSKQQQVNFKDKQDNIQLKSQNNQYQQVNQNPLSNSQANYQQNDNIKFQTKNKYSLDNQKSIIKKDQINRIQKYDRSMEELNIYDQKLNIENLAFNIQQFDKNNEDEVVILQIKTKCHQKNNSRPDDDSDSSIEIIDKNEFNKSSMLKPKRISKQNKNEKTKQKEFQVMLRKKEQIQKEVIINTQFDKKYNIYQIFSQPVAEKIQFFVFCDIYIEDKLIKGNRQQTKRSDINNIKQISKIIDKENYIEVVLERQQQTLMEFENQQKVLLCLQDQYAKEVSDSLSNLQEKSRLALETIQMIQNNRSIYDYILQRKQHAEQAYESFKMKTLPQHKYFVCNRYTFDLRNGNVSINDIIYSKEYIKLLAINTDYFKQMMSKYGLIEFYKQSSKLAFQINLFNQFIFNMKNMPQVVSYLLDFVTLDNIEIKLSVVQHMIDLCIDFDELNKFDCPFIDFVCIGFPQITDEVEKTLAQIRLDQNIDVKTLLEMEQDEIDFYYNNQSLQFMKKYYSDTFSRNLDCPDLSKQKVDFTNIQK